MEDNGKLILWGTLVVILLIIIGIINPFLLILIITIFTYLQFLVTLSNRSESNLRIKLLQNDSRINFHFYSQTYKIETT